MAASYRPKTEEANLTAQAIYEALKRDAPRALIQGEPIHGYGSVIDGKFNLLRVARQVLVSLRRAALL